jgi:hypothetical protein
LINTRSLSIVIDKPIPLSIGCPKIYLKEAYDFFGAIDSEAFLLIIVQVILEEVVSQLLQQACSRWSAALSAFLPTPSDGWMGTGDPSGTESATMMSEKNEKKRGP